jgi:NAD(P)-dependent dehydrogenase (short-subunit alcohol dehydrogenase family)
MDATRGKVILITGASAGIGRAAARALRPNNTLLITGRSQQTQELARELDCEAFLCDFGKLSDVRKLANDILSKHRRIDVLCNNVGGIMGGYELTAVDHERTLQVNHLAPFLLTILLQPSLEASRGVVINTSSGAHWWGQVKPPDLETKRGTSAQRAYGTAKLLNILHAMEISRRFVGVRAAAFHPGPVATRFARDAGPLVKLIYETPLKHLALISPERGADTLVWMAQNSHEPGVWESGGYYVKRKPGLRSSQAKDAKLAAGAWDASVKLLDLAPAPTLRAVPAPL